MKLSSLDVLNALFTCIIFSLLIVLLEGNLLVPEKAHNLKNV